MFLGVVTNQDLMNRLEVLNSKSVLEIILNAFSPIILALLTMWLTSYITRKQVREDKELQLKVEEKIVIDKQIIEHLAEIHGLLYPALKEEVFFNSSKIYYYYQAVKNGADEKKEKQKLRKTYEASGKLHRSRQLRINTLIAFAPKNLRTAYRSLTIEMLNFEHGAFVNQYPKIYNNNQCNPAYPMYSEEDFIKKYDEYMNRVVSLVDNIQDEFEKNIDQAKRTNII